MAGEKKNKHPMVCGSRGEVKWEKAPDNVTIFVLMRMATPAGSEGGILESEKGMVFR